MKHWIRFLAIIYITSSVFGQHQQPKDLGIGFAIASNPYELNKAALSKQLFKDKALTQKWSSESIAPFFFKPDYGLCHFICLEKTTTYYKILANGNEVAYLANDTTYYFKTWETVLLQSTIQRQSKDNPIQKECVVNGEIITNDCEFDQMTVNDVTQKNNEHWLYVSFSSDCENQSQENSTFQYGWIKWRIGNKLLINILLLC